jgi:hypothetical protein
VLPQLINCSPGARPGSDYASWKDISNGNNSIQWFDFLSLFCRKSSVKRIEKEDRFGEACPQCFLL